MTESTSCFEIKEAFGLKVAEQQWGISNLQLFFCFYYYVWPHRQLGEGRIVDPASKCVLLELQELDNQTSQGFTGRGVVLDILNGGKTKKWVCTQMYRKEKKNILPPRLSFKTSFNWLYSTIPNSTVAPGTKVWSVFGGPESSMTVILCLAVRRHRNVAKTLQRITDHTLRWWWWWTCSQFLHKRGSYKTLQNCLLGGI